MDARTAAHTLTQIAAYLELLGENRFKVSAYRNAARALLGLGDDDLAAAHRSGALAQTQGLGPATLAVVRDLIEHGESRYLEQLRAEIPEGFLELARIPSLTAARLRTIHEALGISTVEELEAAARDGRLAKLPRFGAKTAAKILDGIAMLRETGALRLYHHALVEGERLRESVASHPKVVRAELAGPLRRRMETVGMLHVVAACRDGAEVTLESFARLPGVAAARIEDGVALLRYVDGAELQLRCVPETRFGVAMLVDSGSDGHVDGVREHLRAGGFTIDDQLVLRDADGRAVQARDEAAVYRRAGLQEVPPELREGMGEIEAAAKDALPDLVDADDIRGILHCHTHYSDGKSSVAEMARAARERGWSYIGISDHSEAAFYAGGLSRERILAQHEEIDELNAAAADDFRILKGIEADILADGRLDYDDEWLGRFDYVIGSIHSRFSMEGAAMTERVLRAMDDPHLTILAHPTGRLLLSRPPYALDVPAVIAKAAEVGVAVELNVDPRRMDLDWRYLPRARAAGARVAIGPDAHSTGGLDNVRAGIGMARKGWLEARDILNTGSADDVLAFARARRR